MILMYKYLNYCFKVFLLQLLEYETQVNLQIPLLLKYQQDNIALKKAVESGNTDLVYMVLLHMQTTMPLGKFQVSKDLKTNNNLVSKLA